MEGSRIETNAPLYCVEPEPYVEPKELHDGSIMEGDFDHGTGFGTRTFPDKTVWEGNFSGWALNGKGEIRGNGYKYEGEFENKGLVSGKITYYFEKGAKTEYEGSFIDYELNGKGTITKTHSDGHVTVLEGRFKKGKLDGPGIETIDDRVKNEVIYLDGTLRYLKV